MVVYSKQQLISNSYNRRFQQTFHNMKEIPKFPRCPDNTFHMPALLFTSRANSTRENWLPLLNVEYNRPYGIRSIIFVSTGDP